TPKRSSRPGPAERYLTVRVPFIPRAAWPGTVQRYLYFPALKVTVSFTLLPCEMSAVFLPLILKSCWILPLFTTVNVTLPCGTTVFESLNLKSDPVTVTVATLACEHAARGGTGQVAETT